ncbi:MAG: DUF1287 domain-containing protein [Pseudomonadota bacterium]
MIRTLLTTLWLTLGTLPLLAAPGSGMVPSHFVAAAREQVGVTTGYDPAYATLAFPGGDVRRDRGAATDVVIRAMRDGWHVDLQLAVNRDMTAEFSAYPALWGLTTPDRNIDHRRVPNLVTLLTRLGASLPVDPREPTPFLPGDLVTWELPGNLAHIGIVSDRRSADGTRPLILHNIGQGAEESDVLLAYPITGQFRVDAQVAARLRNLGT